ncbi:MAG: hypothetical protein KDD75_04910 [Caldilineaceae bacterium]|nr:hypothetical protein [Caldilineaceae bacterium]MCB0134433.1 hypothetical protein [Caldilineaceae bacterium]
MALLGLHVNLLIGPTVPLPVPPPLLANLDSIEVTHSDEGRSGFQIVFKGTRSRAAFMDYPLFLNPQFRVGHRAIISVTFGPLPTVLMDGIITNQQLTPAQGSEPAVLTLTGEDISFKMDQEEKSAEHPAQSDNIIAMKIIATYAVYGMIPLVIPPLALDVPLPIDRVPVQQATDLAYLTELATRHAYVFYVTPGPVIGTNTAYWGPPVRIGVPQKALNVDLGPVTNVTTINFQNDAAQATSTRGTVQDRTSNQQLPVLSFLSTRPPLALDNALLNKAVARVERFRAQSGQTVAQAMAQAQAVTDASTNVVKAEGELNTAAYGAPLRARGLVGLRGVGLSYDGLYYVQKVTHTIRAGDYKQKFSLTREGLGSTIAAVIP